MAPLLPPPRFVRVPRAAVVSVGCRFAEGERAEREGGLNGALGGRGGRDDDGGGWLIVLSSMASISSQRVYVCVSCMCACVFAVPPLEHTRAHTRAHTHTHIQPHALRTALQRNIVIYEEGGIATEVLEKKVHELFKLKRQ